MNLIVPAGHVVKMKKKKKSEKWQKHFDLDRELRKLWNMGVTIMPIVVGAFRMFPKNRKGDWKSWKIE